jgi:hypothetical protein
MGGMVIDVRIKEGSEINKGDPIAILNAMKMVSQISLVISRLCCRRKSIETNKPSFTGNGHFSASLRKDRKPFRQGRRFGRLPGSHLQDCQIDSRRCDEEMSKCDAVVLRPYALVVQDDVSQCVGKDRPRGLDVI